MSSDVFAWIFPGGALKTVTIAATAGNVVTNKTPGAGKRWLVLHGKIILVTNITVANRYIELHITDGTNILHSLGQHGAVTASLTSRLGFGPAKYILSIAAAYDHGYIGFDPLMIEDDDQLRIVITNGVAGDSYSGYIRVLEISI